MPVERALLRRAPERIAGGGKPQQSSVLVCAGSVFRHI